MHFKRPAKWQPFHLGLNVLTLPVHGIECYDQSCQHHLCHVHRSATDGTQVIYIYIWNIEGHVKVQENVMGYVERQIKDGWTHTQKPWWRHQMETFSALLAICAGNSPVPGEFPTQRPVTRSFDVFFDLPLNKRLSKQSWGWWLETLSRPLWRHRNAKLIMAILAKVGRGYTSNLEITSIHTRLLLFQFGFLLNLQILSEITWKQHKRRFDSF